MNFVVKVTYLKPVENSEKMKRIGESYIVNAESIVEADMKVSQWMPANFQDADSKGVNKTAIADINVVGDSETWWLTKIVYEDSEGRSKPFQVAINGDTAKKAIEEIEKLYFSAVILGISQTNIIFDRDLFIHVDGPKETVSTEE